MKPKSIWMVMLEALATIVLVYVVLPITLAVTPYFFFNLDQSLSFLHFAVYVVWLRIAIEYVVDLVSGAWHGKKHNR